MAPVSEKLRYFHVAFCATVPGRLFFPD